ncbi:uncharacterized protein LOC122061407 [Macadamia integrifolia]|uniref:uncharacterized protein LOC122061407 n=1 Tax=Macadamia integrifolia TaxID=60698 RepID=UPI001C50168A|nr:uncharacterized protein LOC122061407 [Macadamia integrifolia]
MILNDLSLRRLSSYSSRFYFRSFGMRTKTPASRSTIDASTGGMGQEDELGINEQRKNITWTKQMDETMIRCPQVQVWEEKKIGNSFKELAYNFVAKEKEKEFMKLRNMTWPLFEELKKVVDEDHITGEFFRSNRDSFRQRKDKGTTSEEPRPYIHPVDHMEIGETNGSEDLNTVVPMSTSHSKEGNGAGATRERKRAKVALDGHISSIAASIDRLATVV